MMRIKPERDGVGEDEGGYTRRDERQEGKSEARIKISQMKRRKGIILKYY